MSYRGPAISSPWSGTGPRRTLRKQVELCRCLGGGNLSDTAIAAAVVKTPSKRLSLYLHLEFIPTAGQRTGLTFNAANNWTITKYGRDEFGRAAPGKALVSAEQLPSDYEADSAVRELRVTANFGSGAAGTFASLAGTWVLVAEWDPQSDAVLSEEELTALFGQCDLQADVLPPPTIAGVA